MRTEAFGLVTSDETVACLKERFGRASAQLLVANVLLSVLDQKTASEFADAYLDCAPFGELTKESSGVDLNADEVNCLNDVGQTSTVLRQGIANQIRGRSNEGLQTALGLQMFRCLTPEHAREIGEGGGGLLS